MINPNDIVFLISAVIAASFLLYFSSSAICHRKDIYTKFSGWIGAFIFLALFLRLLSVSSPKFIMSSDLFLLITIATITLLTILLQQNILKNPQEPADVTRVAYKSGKLFSFESFRALKDRFPKGEHHGKTKLISVPRHRQILRLK